MSTQLPSASTRIRLGIGLAAGLAVAAVDNFAFGGEVSPIVIVALLLVATATADVVWERQGWLVVVALWVCVPFVHLIKHISGLPDTLNPNTYTSILLLAGFTFVVSIVGLGGGVLVGRITREWVK